MTQTAQPTLKMRIPMHETPCDWCQEKAINSRYAWKDEQVELWVGFCSAKCRNAFCDHSPTVR